MSQVITVNLIPDGRTSVLSLTQSDVNREFYVRILDGESDIDWESEMADTIVLTATTPSGDAVVLNYVSRLLHTTINGPYYTAKFITNNTMVKDVGEYDASIQVTFLRDGNTNVSGSASFKIHVQANTLTSANNVDDSEITIFQELVQEMEGYASDCAGYAQSMASVANVVTVSNTGRSIGQYINELPIGKICGMYITQEWADYYVRTHANSNLESIPYNGIGIKIAERTGFAVFFASESSTQDSSDRKTLVCKIWASSGSSFNYRYFIYYGDGYRLENVITNIDAIDSRLEQVEYESADNNAHINQMFPQVMLPNEVINYGGYTGGAFLTGSGTNFRFSLPLSLVSTSSGLNVTVSSLRCIALCNGTYIIGSAGTWAELTRPAAGCTISATINASKSAINFLVVFDESLGSSYNNMACGLFIDQLQFTIASV